MPDNSEFHPHAEGQQEPTLFCGVNTKVLKQMLELFRDKYLIADEANFFLEILAHTSGINVGIANQRDALSHLVTLLRRPELPVEDQFAQVIAAEEHLRRAVIESYDKAVSIEFAEVLTLYDAYRDVRKKLTLDTIGLCVTLANLPEMKAIDQCIDEIQKARLEGRHRKIQNAWDAQWVAGVRHYIEAYKLAVETRRELQRSIEICARLTITLNQSKRDRARMLVTVVAAVFTISRGWEDASGYARFLANIVGPIGTMAMGVFIAGLLLWLWRRYFR